MASSKLLQRHRNIYLAVTVLLASQGVLRAQPANNPQAPTINFPMPLGAARGASVELTLTGANLAGATGVWTSFAAAASLPMDHNNGKDEGKLRVRLDIAREAALGFGAIRVATARGISNLRLFCIDDLPAIQESEGNHTPATAQAVPIPCVITGRADAETSDFFKIHVKSGQRLSFEIIGHRLGSSFDPQLSLHDGHSGKEYPGGHSNDAPGLQTDARLTYTFSAAGECIIEVRDVSYRGGADFWYRLRIGDFPCATTPLPMAARRGSQTTVSFAGTYVEGVTPVEVALPADPAIDTVYLAPRGPSGLYGWPVALALTDDDELLETEPNNTAAQANRLPVPCGVTGIFEKAGDVDHYVFACHKGRRYRIRARTTDLNSPTEVLMTLRDSKGGQLAVSNPAAPPLLDFTAPADGDYTLAVEHLLSWGGPAETYHVSIEPHEPGFELAIGDRLEIPSGGVAALPIVTFTRENYGGPVELRVVGDAGFHGQATLGPEQPRPADQPRPICFVHVNPETPPGAHAIAVEGSAWVNGKLITRRASVRAAISEELAGLAFPPRNLTDGVGVAVTDKPPFTLTARLSRETTTPGNPLAIAVRATRTAGFSGEIVLDALNLPPNVAAALANIPANQVSATATITPAANAALGQTLISFGGKGKLGNREYHVIAAPVSLALEVPFTLQIEPAKISVSPGGKAKVKVLVQRGGGFTGPISVEWRNLPPGVSAPKTTIGEGKSDIEVEVAAAANVAPVIKTDVQLIGTAVSLGNQQHASPNATIEVRK